MNDALKPGPELNALVAEKVMGLTMFAHGPLSDNGMCGRCWRPAGEGDILPTSCRPPHYSTDMTAACEVFAKLNDTKNYSVGVEVYNDQWRVIYGYHDSCGPYGVSAPHAICLAALYGVE